MEQKKPHAGIYLLPNLFTTGALFAGFYAIVAGINHSFSTAAIAIFVAGLLDGLDGRVARLTNTQSEFGVQYDSLADLISFGLAPALIMYLWSLSSMKDLGEMGGKLGWLAAFLYATCAALRLARFNTQVDTIDKRYFQGLASPAAAGTLMSLVWFAENESISGQSVWWIVFPVVVVVALLMVSNIRYFSFKSWPMREKVPFLWLLPVVLIFVLLASNPALVLLVTSSTYVVSGVILTLIIRKRHKNKKQSDHQSED